MSSGSASLDDSLSRSYSVSASDRGRDNVPTRDYDGLKSQCDKAMHDLQVLRRQHNETVRRCEHTMKELEYYRGQHHAAMAQLESAAQESSSSLRPKFSDLVPDLRSSQEGETMANDALNQLYINTVTKYEAFKEEYEILRKRYDDLISSHSAAVNKLELAQEEVGRLKKQCEDMVSERNVAIRERNGLKQQCTAAIRQWDIALRERNEYQEALVKVQHQHEEAVKEINQATVVRMKANKDLKRLAEERDAAMQEYSLIMSERDSVHKEMEKLSDGLTQSLQKNKSLEAENKQLTEDKKTLTYQVETLKREITSALHDRDKALKECNDLREKFGEYTAKEESQRDSLKSRYDYREWDVGHKDLREAQSRSMDLFGKCQKERMDNLDQANQEIDRLRKQLDKIQVELQEALQEAEVCKRRRDWAFSERDKIVLERESIRTLCDKLRKERDRAVSELAQALRDSDDIKKQRNETTKQLKVLEEKMEAQLEKESRMVQLHSASNYSHDSAIDTDMQDWDTEMLVIDLNGLTSTKDIGIELVGGREDPHYPNDNGVYVASVSKGGIADGKLKINDCILRINNVDCTNATKRFIFETMKTCGNTAVMVVRRRRLYTTQLQLNKYDHGLSLETGIFISKISPGSLASKDGNLAVGDRVIYINNRSLDGLTSAREAMALINEPNDVLTITTLKSSNVPSGFSSKQINASTQTHTHQEHHAPVYRHSPVTNLMSEPNSGPKSIESGTSSGFNKWRSDLKEEKKRNRNSSPVTFEQERDDAIAELDSVIDSYHPLTASGQGTVRRRQTHTDKNGGTWPKARGGPVIENNTGTIVHPRRKERLPLSLFLASSPNYTHMCCDRDPQPSRGSNTSTLDFPKAGTVDYYVKKKGRESGDAYSRIHSQLYGSPHYTFTPFHPHPPHPHAHSPPPTYHLATDSRPFCFEPPYNPLSQCHHSHAPSVDSHYHKKYSASHNSDDGEHTSFHLETGTFPRKKKDRFRINWTPPGPITPGPKLSSGSIEKSERGSPMLPTFSVEVIDSPIRRPFTTSLPEYYWPHKPSSGELRRVRIDKSAEPLGIQISCLESGGVFVSTVNENSIASQVGLQVGDQLLEVCGINMRSATYKLAANVLRQCGNSITMLVQYNPEKYNETEGTGSSSSNGSKTRSGSPTPCNTPRANRKSLPAHSQLAQAISSLTQYSQSPSEEPRYLMIETHKCSNLGISLVGGNAVGIYVHSVQNGSLAYNAGLRTGDRILEYNGTDLSQATAEEAAYELAKPADKVKVRAHYCIERYNEIKDKPGDSFYIKAQFDRLGDVGDALQLKFKKDDILYVDNTMFNGVPGSWRAWLLDADGGRQQCGIIPSKYKVEEEVVRRSLGDLEGEARRATRRSFFRRKKSHQRSDSKELASFSQNFGWYSDSGTLNEDSVLASYQRVSRLNCSVLRPVLVVGPLADCVTEKLIQDFPDKFARCSPEIMHCPQSAMEKGIADNLFVDYKKKGSFFECTSISAIRDMCDKNVHCIIDVGLTSIERLHKQQIYPIVLLIKFKSIKQIKEVKDTTRYTVDKISAKAAKEMYEHALKLESEYKHLISTTIHASAVNIAYMCTQIKDAVHHEQLKPLWVPCSGL